MKFQDDLLVFKQFQIIFPMNNFENLPTIKLDLIKKGCSKLKDIQKDKEGVIFNCLK